jgi:hypothetical protein
MEPAVALRAARGLKLTRGACGRGISVTVSCIHPPCNVLPLQWLSKEFMYSDARASRFHDFQCLCQAGPPLIVG